ncbi:MAG TPA: alpha/beta hydrolase [Vicinamibacterales bacterium]|nr:alpha/beta hydrolase [Vicinamibacterales bacterium]
MGAAAAVVAALLLAGVIYQQVSIRRRRFAPPGELIELGLPRRSRFRSSAKAGGHRLHARCAGSGAPLVLLESGIAASSLSWSLVQPEIATFTRVCAYDRAGFAWSDPASSPRTFDRIVDELACVLDRVGAGERYVLVGHSFGSFVIRAYAAKHPDRVVGLVLVDPPTEWLAMTAQQRRLIRRGRRLSRVGGVLAQLGIVRASLTLLTGGAPGAPRRLVKVFGPTAAGTLQRLVGEVRKLPTDVHPMVQEVWCDPKCFRSMAAHLRVLETEGPAIEATLPPEGIPVIVISSGNHPPEEIAQHRALALRASAARHVVADRSTHWVQFDQPELIVGAVRDLINAQKL